MELITGVWIIYWGIVFALALPLLACLLFTIKAFASYRDKSVREMRKFYLYTSFLYSLIYFQPGIFKECIGCLFCRTIGEIKYVTAHVYYKCDDPI